MNFSLLFQDADLGNDCTMHASWSTPMPGGARLDEWAGALGTKLGLSATLAPGKKITAFGAQLLFVARKAGSIGKTADFAYELQPGVSVTEIVVPFIYFDPDEIVGVIHGGSGWGTDAFFDLTIPYNNALNRERFILQAALWTVPDGIVESAAYELVLHDEGLRPGHLL